MEAYIIDGVRTPIGKYKGTLSAVRVDDLGAIVIKALAERNSSIPKDAYEDVSWVVLTKQERIIVMLHV